MGRLFMAARQLVVRRRAAAAAARHARRIPAGGARVARRRLPLGSVYGFLQLPLYQYVNGVQLTADWSIVAGVSARF